MAFFSELQGPSLIINPAQLVSPSVALPAELVNFYKYAFFSIFHGERELFCQTDGQIHVLEFVSKIASIELGMEDCQAETAPSL